MTLDGDPIEILRTSVSVTAFQPWPRHVACIIDDDGHVACIIDDDMLVWLMPSLCTCSLYYQVFCVHSLLSLFCLNTQKLQLGCIDCYYYLHACELVAACSQIWVIATSCVHRTPEITTETFMPSLCTCSLYYQVFCVHSLLPLRH